MDKELTELLVRFFVLTVSLTIHEFAHAWSAYRFGDDTAARLGRLSLNPLVHMDILGSLLILTGMPIGWAKPVPVDAFRMRDPRRDMALVSFAGPASNLILGTIFCALFYELSDRAVGTGWYQMLLLFIHINFSLAIFNLLPLYPLDGSKVLPLLLSKNAALRYEETMARLSFWPLVLLFLLRAPLQWWFELWNPLLQPIFHVFGVPSFW